MSSNFFKSIFTKPPVLFPLVALFHLFIFCYSFWWDYGQYSFPSEYWLPTIWLLAYFIVWLFICNLKKWAALMYVALTSLHILLHYMLKYKSEVAIYTPSFLIVFILFSFFVLFYFRKFT